MSETQALLDGYWRWLRDKSAVRDLGEWKEITTPYLDRHNDYLQIYIRSDNGRITLTDGGDTLIDLEQSGCAIESPRRQEVLRTILNGFGIQQANGALQVHATADNFPIRKHNLVQALLAVQDMFYLAASTVESVFFEDVAAWLDENDVRYTPRVKFAGHSGFDHMFDFAIPGSKRAPERIVRALNNPSRSNAQNFCWAWFDTRQTRPGSAEPYAFLNNNERVIPGGVIEALIAYGIKPVPWSDRTSFGKVLAA